MRVRRTQQMRADGSPHPTHDLIVTSAVRLIKEHGVAAFHIDDVLAAADVTRGALYHHFDNVTDLLESALLAIYSEGIDLNMAFVRSVLATAASADDFRSGVLAANRAYAHNEELRAVRRLRAHAMATITEGSKFAADLASKQQALTDAYVEVISDAQHRGWVSRAVDPTALATFIQAYSFGVIIDDVSEVHLDRDRWASIIETFFVDSVFRK